jgi:hypothetical protein
MLEFFCDKGERVKANKILDIVAKNSNLSHNTITNFSDLLVDTLGLDDNNMNEVSLEEFDNEFCNYFKNNKNAVKIWTEIKLVLENNNCQLWM